MHWHSSNEYFTLAVMLPQPVDDKMLLLPDHCSINHAVIPGLPMSNSFQASFPHSVSWVNARAAGFTLAKGHHTQGEVSCQPLPHAVTPKFLISFPSTLIRQLDLILMKIKYVYRFQTCSAKCYLLTLPVHNQVHTSLLFLIFTF